MRRLSIAVLAGVLLVGLVAAPATADRDIGKGNLPHFTSVWLLGQLVGEPEVVEVPTGEWVRLGTGWFTATEAQRDDFVGKAIVEIECDGVPQEATLVFADFPGEGYLVAYQVLTEPGRAKVGQDWTVRVSLTEPHFDGWDWYPAGVVDEGNRTVVWIPRGQFQFAD